ncbi:MAG: HAD-IIIC family phosphatase [Gammaproteobacteria bacterium]|nr:HAD-IIIC family phosphatase [Gammaproteobacteria bacterium]MBU1623999.1 HAD-IIIC family phosphatase [Gammaproteobacteria bacterium]MBU1981727.1 HAD-IIIC family phosphatase [Gammaproteobacteria bacterium]
MAQRSFSPLSGFRLGILSNTTFDLLADYLPAAAARHGVALDVLLAPYDQVVQQAVDPGSAINTGRLDACLIAVDHRWLKLDRPCLASDPREQVEAAIEQLRMVVRSISGGGGIPVILQLVPSPPQSLFGNYDGQVAGTVRSMLGIANELISSLAKDTGSFILDARALAESVGTDHWFNPSQWVSYKFPFSSECFPIYADNLGRLLGAIRGKARKCLVLDLDNTIWGGAIGDDGIEGIVLAEGSSKGEAFLSVQRAALELRERGIILAVCSKNNEDVARSAFREHREMLLKEEHVAAFRANWTDKASNLEAIAQQLNIGLDALVLLDDNPVEREFVRRTLPMVAVPELPTDPSWFSWYLSSAGYFEAAAYSAEDQGRAGFYSADTRRNTEMTKAANLEDYLLALDMSLAVAPFDHKGRQRIAQLINKTNQFNLTTRRYTEAEIAAMENGAAAFTLQARLHDKFGDLGMIGVLICKSHGQDEAAWEIDTWLMSCRVLGRKIEEAMLAHLVRMARESGVAKLIGTYVPSQKNGMVQNHYGNLGFSKIEPAAAGNYWALDLNTYVDRPIPVRIIPVAGQAAT